MLSTSTKRHAATTVLALVGCYGALLSSDAPSGSELPLPALEHADTAFAAPAVTAVASAAPSHAVVSPLSARLSELEAHTPPSAAPATTLTDTQPPAADSQTGSEPALADWMRAAIRGEEWDRARTQTVEAELNASLDRLPELHAEELECGKRFCRALLFDRRGEPVQLRPLFGAPPFDGEGFTTLGQHGQAEVFFTRAGQSLDSLRQEASL